MKKSLWITAAAMAVGIGMSAQAATNAALGQWSFETLSVGDPIPSRSNPIVSPAGYDSWSADTNNGTAYITNATPSGVMNPISAAAHTKGLYFDGSVTNHFDMSTAGTNRYFTDFLLKPGQLEDQNLIANLDTNVQLAFFFNTSSNFVLVHGDSSQNFQTSTFALVSYETNAWLRITIDQDYGAVEYPPLAHPMFTIFINGTNLVHENGYTRSGNTFNATGEGPWFPMKAFGSGMHSLVGMGIGMLDDVVTATTVDFGSPAPTEIGLLASVNNAVYGSIAPFGYNATTNGVRTFTLTVATNMCYVMGITVGGTLYTNTDANATAVAYDVTLAQAAAGTNVVGLFGVKSGTSGSYLDNYFDIGSSNYPDFVYATTNDADSDTFTDLQEAICGTDPTNALSFLTINNIAVDGSGNVVVSFVGSTVGLATNYIIYDANTVTGVYSAVTNFAKVGGTNNISLTPATPKKFYKVVTPDPGL